MPKEINIELSSKSIDAAIKKLRNYQKKLNSKNTQLVEQLGKLGEEYVRENSQGTECDPGTVKHVTGRWFKAEAAASRVIWTGEEISFIEFGAGVYFNGNPHGSPHPVGEALGMTIGDYGYHQGLKDSWKKPNGEWTHGTPAMMPMWRAVHAEDGLKGMVAQVAREVFD